MSSDKKSSASLIILLLVFALIAGVSWFFFSKQKGDVTGDVAKTKQEIIDQLSNATEQDSHTGHDHGHGDHNDAHGTTATSSANNEQVGIKGTVHKLNPPAIYGRRAVGNPNAPVQIQEFFSLTCNHCADFHKGTYQDIKKNLIDTGKVYFIYEEFPLNGPALYGSMIARCLPEERYAGFIDILFRTQDQWAFGGDFKSALLQNAKLAGMSEAEFDTCFNNKDLQKAVAVNIKDASEAWKVNSTPSFVVNNGERIIYGSKPYESFERLVQQLMDAEKPSATTEPATDTVYE